jgi:hypothetical protein
MEEKSPLKVSKILENILKSEKAGAEYISNLAQK